MENETSGRRAEMLESKTGVRCLVEFGGVVELAETLNILLPNFSACGGWRFVPEAEGGTPGVQHAA